MYSFNQVVLLFIVSSFICVIYSQNGDQQQPDQNLVWLGQDDPYVLKLPKLVNVNLTGEVKVLHSNVDQIVQTKEPCNGIAVADLEVFQKNMENKFKDATEMINTTISTEIATNSQTIEEVKNVLKEIKDAIKEERNNVSSEIPSIKKEISGLGDAQSVDKQNTEKLKEKIEDVHNILNDIKDAIKEIRNNVSSEITDIKKEVSGVNVLGAIHQQIMETYKDTIVKEFQDGIKEFRRRVSSEIANITSVIGNIPGSCKEIYKTGNRKSGVYIIRPKTMTSHFEVFCDMETHGGGWTVIQNRIDGRQDFDLSWDSYKVGFGDINNEFWIGLENIFQMTRNEKNELLMELVYHDGTQLYARYTEFGIGPESTNYTLTTVQGYSGNGADSLIRNMGSKFSTKDSRISDLKIYSGGWWLFYGSWSNFNGQYSGASTSDKKTFWYSARAYECLAKTKMLIRPV